MAKAKDVKANADVTTIEIGGRTRTLVFDMNAFAELETRFGTISEAMEALASGQIKNIRTVLWAALIHDEVKEFDKATGEPVEYGITPFEVGSWVTSIAQLTEVAQLLGKAIGKNMPATEDLPQDVLDKMKEAGIKLPEEAKEDTARNVKVKNA